MYKIDIMNEQQMIDHIIVQYGEWIEHFEKMGWNGERVVSLILATRLKKALEREEISNYVQHAR